MTAYLQPGDKIHIVFPLSSNIGESLPDASRRIHAEYCAMYNQVGVELIGSTGNTTLNHPVIVAVIREPEHPPRRAGTDSLIPSIPRRYRSAEKLGLQEDPPLPWQDPAETTEPPRGKEFLPHGLPPE